MGAGAGKGAWCGSGRCLPTPGSSLEAAGPPSGKEPGYRALGPSLGSPWAPERTRDFMTEPGPQTGHGVLRHRARDQGGQEVLRHRARAPEMVRSSTTKSQGLTTTSETDIKIRRNLRGGSLGNRDALENK